MLLNKIYDRINIGINFYLRSYLLRKNLLPIDKKSPFKGKLSHLGYDQFEISKKSLQILKSLYKRNGELLLTLNERYAIKEVFLYANKEVREYLGKSAYLDGIKWLITSKNKTHNTKKRSDSISWHTDNVGARLKLFLCIKGDGSQPTMVIPDTNRTTKITRWLFNIFMESFRWWGFLNTKFLSKSIAIKHKTGSAFMFDTQLLHRGSYEFAEGERVILLLEFSVPEKHHISRGPIGTKKGHNTFKFEKKLLHETYFRNLLDVNRIKKSNICSYEN